MVSPQTVFTYKLPETNNNFIGAPLEILDQHLVYQPIQTIYFKTKLYEF